MAAQIPQENQRGTRSCKRKIEDDEEVRVADKWTKVHGANSRIHRLIEGMSIPKDQDILEREIAGDENCLCLGPGMNCFVVAIVNKRSNSSLQLLLKIEPEGVNYKDQNGLSLLMLSLNDARQVRLLLENGADPNAEDFEGNTVLMRAFMKTPNLEVINTLIEGGAKLYFPSSNVRPENNIFTFALRLLLEEKECTILRAIKPAIKNTQLFTATHSLFKRAEATSSGIPLDAVDEFRHIFEIGAESKQKVLALTLRLQGLCPGLEATSVYNYHFDNDSPWRFSDVKIILEIAGGIKSSCLVNLLGRTIYKFFTFLHGYSPYAINRSWTQGGTNLVQMLQGQEIPLDVLDPCQANVLSPGIVLVIEFLKLKVNILRREWNLVLNRGPAEPMEFLGLLHLFKGNNFPTYLSGEEGTYWHDSYIKFVPVELLVIHMSMYLESKNEDEELYKAMLPFTPVHPFALYEIDEAFEAAFLKQHCYQGLNLLAQMRNKSLPVLQKVVEYVLKCCGSHYGGILYNPGSRLFKVEVLQYKPASLKDMSRWALRMAIAEKRVTKSLSLPAYIKKLVEQGFLHKQLGNYLLVFPPSKYFPY